MLTIVQILTLKCTPMLHPHGAPFCLLAKTCPFSVASLGFFGIFETAIFYPVGQNLSIVNIITILSISL